MKSYTLFFVLLFVTLSSAFSQAPDVCLLYALGNLRMREKVVKSPLFAPRIGKKKYLMVVDQS